ncbi:MAG: tetratricopeptide repeat protein [Candidatus Eisenbacteria bacterium]|uniref:Tetratricopeptide repeat protein n=1 Tax=Eiseniibacteriota bacterium TaxID=2212470 RepID=A0A538TZR5_UNCEI|nr:MAG: tetratricopeptide repeat protein [Candidatus Eisenbacteria bacterium]
MFPGYAAYLWPWFAHSPDRAAPRLAATPGAETMIGALCVLAVVAVFLGLLWRRSRVGPALALALFPLVPPLVLASTRGYGLFGERHIYLPSAGVVWAAALAGPAWAARLGRHGGRIVVAVAGVLVLGGALETLRIIPAYHDDETMYRTMTAREPGNPTGFVGLADELTRRGRLDESLTMLARAQALDPALASVFVGRARVAAQRQDWDGMLAAAGHALTLDRDLQSAWLLRGLALMRLRRLDEAGRDLERLRQEYPGHPEVGAVWGQYLIERGRPAEALPVLAAAAGLLAEEPSLWDAIGVASGQTGRWEDARAAFQHTVALSPGYLAGWLRLAAACQRLGDAPGRNRALTQADALPNGPPAVAAFQRQFGTSPR